MKETQRSHRQRKTSNQQPRHHHRKQTRQHTGARTKHIAQPHYEQREGNNPHPAHNSPILRRKGAQLLISCRIHRAHLQISSCDVYIKLAQAKTSHRITPSLPAAFPAKLRKKTSDASHFPLFLIQATPYADTYADSCSRL